MAFWLIALLVLGATVAFSYLTARRTQVEKRKPAGLGDFNFPTATEARPIPVVVGTVKQRAPNCTWYGDLQTIPIKTKVPNPATFGLTKKTVETGQYRYFVGMMLGLAHGEGVRLREFHIDDKTVWTGNLLEGSFSFDKSELFGGEKKEGGFAGTFDYYAGAWTQPHNAYLQTQNPAVNVSRNPGEAYIIQRGPSSGKIAASTPNGYVGLSPNIRPYSFILQRFPDHLGQTAYTQILGDGDTYPDANPIEWLYEVLTNYDYGMGVAPGMIDTASFQAAALTCFNEKIGLSVLWDSEREIEDVVNDIVRLVDGACFVDRSTGLWTVRLARMDYDPATLPVFDEDNILNFADFGVTVIDESANHFIVNYVDKANGWKDRPADFKNLAAQRQQGAAIPQTLSMYGCANGKLAGRLAFREAKVFASNLRKATFTADRSAHFVRPLSVFIYSRLSAGIAPVVMRAMKVNDGELLNGEIEIECIEDVFSLGNTYYAPPPITGHVAPVGDPAAVAVAFLGEQPYFIGGSGSRLWSFARQPNGAQLNFDLFVNDGGGTYVARERGADFAPTGTLVNSYARTNATDTGSTLRIAMDSGLVRLIAAAASEVAAGVNLFLFADTGEIAAFESLTDNGDGSVTLSNVWRGLLDTVPEAHASGARVWFFTYGQAIPPESYAQGSTPNAKHLPNALAGQLAASGATAFPHTIAARSARPLPPANVRIGGVYNPTAIPAAGADISITWNLRNRLAQAAVLKQSDAGIAPETGQTTTVRVYSAAGALLGTHAGLTGSAFTYTAAMQTADGADALDALVFVLSSERAGISSFQAVRLAVARPTGSVPGALPAYTPAGTYTAPPSDTPTSIAGLPIVGTPSGSPGQTLVTDGNGNLVFGASGSADPETIQDIVAALLAAGAGINVTYNDAGNVLTIAGTIDAEAIDDRIAALLQAGAGINLSYNDPAGTLTISATGGGISLEDVQDNLGNSFLAVGSGLTKVYDDAGNVLTLSVDAEAIQDIVAAMLTEGAGISLAYDDATNSLTISSPVLLPERETVSVVTAPLADGATENGEATLGRTFTLIKVVASDLCRIRLYSTGDARNADAARPASTPPVAGTAHGVILDLNLDASGLLTWILSPEAVGSNAETPPVSTISYAITNLSGSTQALTVEFIILRGEE